MYKVDLFQYKSKFNNIFNINPGNQGSPITFYTLYYYFIINAFMYISRHLFNIKLVFQF
jgi:hypothetical protein